MSPTFRTDGAGSGAPLTWRIRRETPSRCRFDNSVLRFLQESDGMLSRRGRGPHVQDFNIPTNLSDLILHFGKRVIRENPSCPARLVPRRYHLIGKDRLYNRRFLQMCSHYLVDPVACTPASGNSCCTQDQATPSNPQKSCTT